MFFWKPKTGYLSVLIHSGKGAPLAFKLDVSKAYLLLGTLTSIVLGLVVGTLLFFRELESNRELQESLLESMLRERVLAETVKFRQETSAPAQLTVATPVRDVTGERPALRSRVSEVNTECAAGRCAIRIVVVPATSAVVDGSILVVLETEIPRIGTARATSSSQKRFFIYPGYHSKDELDLKEVNRLEGKKFRMSRALNTNVDFQFGELLRPLAVNIFVFDTEKNLVQHERRQIESGD